MDEQESAAGDGGISTRTMEIVVALVLLAVSALVVIDSYRLGSKWGDDGPQSGYFPFYIGGFICLASVATLVQAFVGNRSTAQFVTWAALKQVMLVLLPAIVYVLCVQMIGIYVASAVYIAVFMIWLGKYSRTRSLAVGIGVTVAMFLLFEVWFKVPLYKGLFNPLSWTGY